ncbi:MAG TPA: alpha-galactosidase [Actinocrinis sp.]|nr:alpha-galactosidase [Actinocrinis sp.]
MVQLRAGGVGLVVELADPVPRILHWGRDLGRLGGAGLAALLRTADPAVLHGSIDEPRRFSVWPTEAEGWLGTPAHRGHAGGSGTTPRPRLTGAEPHSDAELRITLADEVSGLEITLTYALDPAGVLAVDATLTRDAGAAGTYQLTDVTALLPVPDRATEALDFTGKWTRERSPQRTALGFGGYLREVRRGRPGLDSPFLLAVGVLGFGFRSGELWAMHVGWSGNQRYLVERLPEGAGVHGAALGGGELLKPGEVALEPGGSYQAPTCYFAWSDEGLDGLAERFHAHLRARPGHPGTPRPLLLNTWEAVYFDHDLDRLVKLADRAALIGVERLVLDDGWFTGRRDDSAGLGDWSVDEQVWPDGLGPLADHVHGLGMQFGLWVEPEMANLASRLAERRPEWLLAPSAGPGPSARHQYGVNLADPDAWAFLLGRLDEVVGRYSVDFLKWDHNRDLPEAVSRGPGGADRPGVRAQTLALYRLLDELRRRHPGLEIESCAAGGGRVDLGILRHTDRVWPSDCNDPVERQAIQRWTGQLVPPELVGTHVGPARAHTTHRVADQSFRLATALFGHAGIEQDLTDCADAELERLAAWAALYRELRPLLHTGRVVRADLGGDDAVTLLHGVVAHDASAAVYCWARVATSPAAQSGRVPLPGLAPDRDYRVRIRTEIGEPSRREIDAPAWVADAIAGSLAVPGVVLTRSGLPMPTLDPGQAMLIDLRAVG